MNERIKELAERAYKECFDDHYYPNYTTDRLNSKFAELIIRECVQVCLAQRDPSNLNYKPSERFAEEIKMHFGVK